MSNLLAQSIKQSPTTTIICCALACEAKPFIDFFKLKKLPQHHAFSLYQSESVFLIVTGMGNTNMSAAVNWLMGVLEDRSVSFCLNIGVAGHQSADLGSLFCALKINSTSSDVSFYPTKAQKHKIKLAVLTSSEHEELNYPSNQLFDMEAFAFFQAATRFNTQENIQCLKVVSDNVENPVSRDKTFISGLIQTHCETIAGFIQQHISALAVYEPSDDRFLEQAFSAMHFSHSQELQLKKLAVSAHSHAIDLSQISTESAKELIHEIEQLLFKNAVDV